MRPGTHRPPLAPASIRVRWRPQAFLLRDPAEAVLRDSVHELSLEGVLREVHVLVDGANREDHAYIEWNGRDHGTARLFFAIGNFVTRKRRRAWARTWGRRAGTPPVALTHFSRLSFAEACLHELLHLRDDHELGIDLSGHPERDREALNELWNVWIDGRLNRRGLPAMPRGERRGIYRRTLSALPGFGGRGERVFRALWRADHLEPGELRAYLGELKGGGAPVRRGSGPGR